MCNVRNTIIYMCVTCLLHTHNHRCTQTHKQAHILTHIPHFPFLTQPALLFEVFPYRYYKRGYGPLGVCIYMCVCMCVNTIYRFPMTT